MSVIKSKPGKEPFMARSDRESRTSETSRRELDRQQEQQLSRRGSYEPFGFSSSEFFSNPFAVMRRMHEEMDRVFAGALGQQAGRSAMGGLGSWAPAIEVSDRGNEICVCAELAGLRPEDVKVEIADDALIIEGERKQERQDEDQGRWHSERQYGSFRRTISLPEGANAEQARAEFKNGELRITVPVERAENKRRQIPISTASGQPENR
jgi:HSP20 family protein